MGERHIQVLDQKKQSLLISRADTLEIRALVPEPLDILSHRCFLNWDGFV